MTREEFQQECRLITSQSTRAVCKQQRELADEIRMHDPAMGHLNDKINDAYEELVAYVAGRLEAR